MSYINDTFGRPMFEKQMNPKHEAYERLCKSIRDMLKENETLKERIKRLEEAGNNLLWNFCPEYTSDFTESQSDALKQWNKAKEAKL